MSSIFFQISRYEFLEAAKIYDVPSKEFALRIISFQSDRENYVFLPEVTMNELSILASIMRLKIVPGFRHLDDLRRYLYGHQYYR